MTIVCLNWTAFTKTARTVTTEIVSYLTSVFQTAEDQDAYKYTCRLQSLMKGRGHPHPWIFDLWWSKVWSGQRTYSTYSLLCLLSYVLLSDNWKSRTKILTEWTNIKIMGFSWKHCCIYQHSTSYFSVWKKKPHGCQYNTCNRSILAHSSISKGKFKNNVLIGQYT